MEEHGLGKIRYAQPQHVTSFMNRPRKQSQQINTTQDGEADVKEERRQQGCVEEEIKKKENIIKQYEPVLSKKKPADYENIYREFEKRADEGGSNEEWPLKSQTIFESFGNAD